jgi:hypothetical protein
MPGNRESHNTSHYSSNHSVASVDRSVISMASIYSFRENNEIVREDNKKYYNIINEDRLTRTNNFCCNPLKITPIFILGFFLMIMSIIEFGLGGGAFVIIQNKKYGAFWVGIFGFATACCCYAAPIHRHLMILACVALSLTLAAAIVGAVADGYTAYVYQKLDTCLSRPSKSSTTNYYFGSKAANDITNVNACYAEYAFNQANEYDCVCVSNANKCTTDLILNDSTDCNRILHRYPDLLSASTAFCCLIGMLCVIGIIISCYRICSKENSEEPEIIKKESFMLPRSPSTYSKNGTPNNRSNNNMAHQALEEGNDDSRMRGEDDDSIVINSIEDTPAGNNLEANGEQSLANPQSSEFHFEDTDHAQA